MGFSYTVPFPAEMRNSTQAVTHSREDMGFLYPAVISLRKKTEVCVCSRAAAAAVAARDGLVEIYITKHPQVHREISKIQGDAGTIKEWFQDVRGGERKEGVGGGGPEGAESLPGCTQ